MRRALLVHLIALAATSQTFSQGNDSCMRTTIALHSVASKKPVTVTYRLETAMTPDTRELGLMNRNQIGACDGMAFFFPKTAPQKFWMKNTHIPLDILFVDEQGKIIHIAHGAPESIEPLGPDKPIATVIEIEAGRAASDHITVGDDVSYEKTPADLLVR